GFTAMVLILTAIFVCPVAYAKPYKPMMISDYTAEIPGETVLPNYLERLEMDYAVYDGAPDGSTLMITFFKDPDFRYLDENGKEIFPYLEVLKFEIKDDKGRVNLVSFVFINAEKEMETYVDEKSLYEPATGKLTKIKSYSKEPFKKVPREK
ncbi:MAG: hypothetical protein Q8L57_00635, partial [bacterium]|nr:hypothetical protein [bacterium]